MSDEPAPDLLGPGVERRRARSFADQHGIAGKQLDDLLLVVSELTTNAILHGGGLIGVTFRMSGQFVVVAVEQHRLPESTVPGAKTGGGFGLLLVQDLAETVTVTVTVTLAAWPDGR
jgi:anti-sigma regulatory factor (Ser/Thr protein kinase)